MVTGGSSAVGLLFIGFQTSCFTSRAAASRVRSLPVSLVPRGQAGVQRVLQGTVFAVPRWHRIQSRQMRAAVFAQGKIARWCYRERSTLDGFDLPNPRGSLRPPCPTTWSGRTLRVRSPCALKYPRCSLHRVHPLGPAFWREMNVWSVPVNPGTFLWLPHRPEVWARRAENLQKSWDLCVWSHVQEE